MSKYYVTTPIYYVNGAPHIGHAYTTIVADALARYHRQRGEEVFLLTGTDEHGLKVQREAEKQGISPQQLAETNSAKFKELFEKLGITHDRFIRTTEEDHKRAVTAMVQRMLAAGDIYLDKYEGWYSAADEAYYDASEIADGVAIASKSAVEWVEEESYFFKLSKYAQPLLAWYNEKPNCIAPAGRRNEVISFVEGGLRDLSISRTTFSWGVAMPGDPKHVLYVWVDALTNYISAVGAFEDEQQFDKLWPADVHLIGKDILRFHAVYWPAFLMSAGLALPGQIFAHGWWTNEGEKMSKSRGNFIDAFELADAYDLDVLRYYLLREVPLGNDGNFSKERLVERNNSELADNLGNLVNRSFAMTQRFLDGELGGYVATDDALDQGIRESARATAADVDRFMNDCETHRAVERLLGFSGELNLYVQQTQPWKLSKDGDTERLAAALYHVLEGIRFIAVLGSAFLPDASKKILTGFGLNAPEDLLLSTVAQFGKLAAGTRLSQPEVLFAKYETKPKEDALPKADKAAKPKAENKPEAKSDNNDKAGLIDFDLFGKVELRVGLIVKAERVEGADKLLKLSADLGEAELRTIVAGIAKSFAPEDLEGRRVAMATNLKPAKLFGILSQAMILAAETEDGKLELAQYSDNVKAGTRIK
ncbi:MAG: methionine--tRNA ligase [Bradymonadaceae bacterium]|nr:methionine--tRNA ligase [Lujinxingiaceae bacterium]